MATTLDQIRRDLRAALPELRRRYPVAYLGVFGSWARGEQREDSDLDLLVELDRPVGLIELASLKLELEDATGLKVDLAQRPHLRDPLRHRILGEALPV